MAKIKYKKKPNGKNDTGRPETITPEVLQKLKEGFAMSFTDTECCLYVGIPTSTLYEYCKKHPDFSEQKEELKKKPSMKAKLNLLKSINNGEVIDSKRRLERKSRDEFSLKFENELTGKDGGPIELKYKTTDELIALVGDIL